MKKLTLLIFMAFFASQVYAQGTLLFEDDFSSGSLDPNWWSPMPNLTGEDGNISVENNIGFNGSFGVRIGKIDDGQFTTNGLDLRLDLAGKTDVELTFAIAHLNEETQDQDGIYFSDDAGATFVKVLDFLPDEWCNNTYGQYPPLDIDELAAVANLGLTSQFVIRFQQFGQDDFFGGTNNQDGIYLDNVRVYEPDLVYEDLPFVDDFNDGVFKAAWAWNFADATTSIMTNNSITSPMNIVGISSQAGIDNSPGAILGKVCDGPFTANALDLHLDLSGETDVEMTFLISGLNEETQTDDGIYFSNDGSLNFVKVLNFFPSEWCNNTYGQHPPLDVDGLATAAGLAFSNQFVIRFQQFGQDDFFGGTNNQDGIYLDNIEVYDPNLVYETLPFEDNFDDGTFKNAWAWNFADATASIMPGNSITSPMNTVSISNQAGVDNTPGVILGKICDGALTTNALDLHLNLLGETDVEMTFWIAGINEETQTDDGIYFSDDGGLNFVKVLDFFPDEWCSSEYGQHPPLDVDGLAAEAGLAFSSQFVVRFQQTGEDDFFGGTNNQDGIYLDNINVYDPNLVYETLPFEDDFDDGTLNNAWAWNFADATASIMSGNSITSPMSIVGVSNQAGWNNTAGVWLGRICDGVLTTNALDLHLNLLGETDVEMAFWIAGINEETQTDDGIYFSDDGGLNFVKVLDFFPDEWCSGEYGQHPPLDVDGLAAAAGLAFRSQFVIRFQQTGEDDFFGGTNNQDGIYLDNISVYDPNLVYAELPFTDDFEEGVLNASWAWNFADETATIVSDDAITNPMSFVGVVDDQGHNNSTYSVWMGRICDGTFTTNALDLHLNLLNQEAIELTFWLAHNNDDTQSDDGVYLSNDGGVSFVQIFNFDFSNTPSGVYEFYQLDLSELAAMNTVALTEFMVIRFQQRGQNDLFGASSNQDGIFLDDVNIEEMTVSTNEIDLGNPIHLYPNPITTELTIDAGELGDAINQITISNSSGMTVYSTTIEQRAAQYQIDLSHLSNGFYFVTLTTEDGIEINKKVVKSY
ncbi:MAG: T9SS type A sorting domain-containing protein [Bacteroidota bacterium]